MKSLLRVDNLCKTFADHHGPVVDHVSFSVQPGEILVLLGPSGCGKTTILRMIGGFERPDDGTIHFQDNMLNGPKVHVPPDQRNIGFVFQDYALFPHMSVLENVMYGLRSLSRAQRRDRALETLKAVGLLRVEDRRPHELSGGQQQRVAVARSIATQPRLILLDEPFSNLDAALRHSTRAEVRRLLRESEMTAVLVTHDQEEALSIADRVIVMRAGVVEQVGRPAQVYRRPRTPFVAQFVGRTNLLQVEARGELAESPLGRMRLSHRADGEVVVSVRPEHLSIEPPRPGRPVAEIISREFKGHDLTYRVRLDTKVYVVQTDYRCPFWPGEKVHLFPVESAVVIDGLERDEE